MMEYSKIKDKIIEKYSKCKNVEQIAYETLEYECPNDISNTPEEFKIPSSCSESGDYCKECAINYVKDIIAKECDEGVKYSRKYIIYIEDTKEGEYSAHAVSLMNDNPQSVMSNIVPCAGGKTEEEALLNLFEIWEETIRIEVEEN